MQNMHIVLVASTVSYYYSLPIIKKLILKG